MSPQFAVFEEVDIAYFEEAMEGMTFPFLLSLASSPESSEAKFVTVKFFEMAEVSTSAKNTSRESLNKILSSTLACSDKYSMIKEEPSHELQGDEVEIIDYDEGARKEPFQTERKSIKFAQPLLEKPVVRQKSLPKTQTTAQGILKNKSSAPQASGKKAGGAQRFHEAPEHSPPGVRRAFQHDVHIDLQQHHLLRISNSIDYDIYDDAANKQKLYRNSGAHGPPLPHYKPRASITSKQTINFYHKNLSEVDLSSREPGEKLFSKKASHQISKQTPPEHSRSRIEKINLIFNSLIRKDDPRPAHQTAQPASAELSRRHSATLTQLNSRPKLMEERMEASCAKPKKRVLLEAWKHSSEVNIKSHVPSSKGRKSKINFEKNFKQNHPLEHRREQRATAADGEEMITVYEGKRKLLPQEKANSLNKSSWRPESSHTSALSKTLQVAKKAEPQRPAPSHHSKTLSDPALEFKALKPSLMESHSNKKSEKKLNHASPAQLSFDLLRKKRTKELVLQLAADCKRPTASASVADSSAAKK